MDPTGSTLFAILLVLLDTSKSTAISRWKHRLDTSKDSQTDFVKFHVNCVWSPNIFDNDIILHKKKTSYLPYLFFSNMIP